MEDGAIKAFAKGCMFALLAAALSAQSHDPKAIAKANEGISLSRQAKYREAVQAYEQAIAIDPSLPCITACRGRNVKVGIVAGSAGSERGKRVDAAAVRRELCHLLAGNYAAHLARFRLDLDGIRFNRNALLCAADFQTQVHTGTLADIQ
jgi:tetratricopeptide (TPR) repeat protein